MGKWQSPIINVRLSWVLVRQIDNLARHFYTTRSDIIRRAVIRYVRDKDNATFANPNSEMIARAYEYIKDDHPYVNPSDTELIMFIAERKAHKDEEDEV
jgi:metal-responsive CopG/Arc/MetJ family transcriptional regulator